MNSLYSLKNIAPDYFRKLLAVFNEDEVIIVQVAVKKFMIPVRRRISEMFTYLPAEKEHGKMGIQQQS